MDNKHMNNITYEQFAEACFSNFMMQSNEKEPGVFAWEHSSPPVDIPKYITFESYPKWAFCKPLKWLYRFFTKKNPVDYFTIEEITISGNNMTIKLHGKPEASYTIVNGLM